MLFKNKQTDEQTNEGQNITTAIPQECIIKVTHQVAAGGGAKSDV